MESTFQIREIRSKDRSWIAEFAAQSWGSGIIISRRKRYDIVKLRGFVAIQNHEYAGLITLAIEEDECQVISLDAIIENIGIGTSLINQTIAYGRQHGCRRVWLITTNDNTPALRFYQTRGFRLKAIYPGEIEYSRELKPEIPLFGLDSIPIQDEIELEYILK